LGDTALERSTALGFENVIRKKGKMFHWLEVLRSAAWLTDKRELFEYFPLDVDSCGETEFRHATSALAGASVGCPN
jgi:hypothetical protein